MNEKKKIKEHFSGIVCRKIVLIVKNYRKSKNSSQIATRFNFIGYGKSAFKNREEV